MPVITIADALGRPRVLTNAERPATVAAPIIVPALTNWLTWANSLRAVDIDNSQVAGAAKVTASNSSRAECANHALPSAVTTFPSASLSAAQKIVPASAGLTLAMAATAARMLWWCIAWPMKRGAEARGNITTHGTRQRRARSSRSTHSPAAQNAVTPVVA
ncbi:MAG: hypothetical protein ACOZIN_21300 [Myxococcota bacterium]